MSLGKLLDQSPKGAESLHNSLHSRPIYLSEFSLQMVQANCRLEEELNMSTGVKASSEISVNAADKCAVSLG